jgi:hypothetical protein
MIAGVLLGPSLFGLLAPEAQRFVSIAGMVAPFMMAIAATPWLMTVPGLFAPTATRFDATLFMGAAIAITAFPMLAGLQAGVIGPALFSMLVLMAIVTTLMASPLFELVYGRVARKSGELGAIESAR